MTGIGTTLAIIFGVIATVLFVIAAAVTWGYLGAGNLYDGLTSQNLVVYGILAAVGAIGAGEWEAHAGRR